ncbi:MAG: DUF167 family protein [Candidatus Nanohaloarchaea archaeon]|nr:DUF167 family protein [Candidatus Nanohaloarchaea archaeon]
MILVSEFYVKAETGAEEFDIDLSGDYPKISLESEARQGRANTELKVRLSEILGSEVAIISGHRSRRKKIKTDLAEEEVFEKIRG